VASVTPTTAAAAQDVAVPPVGSAAAVDFRQSSGPLAPLRRRHGQSNDGTDLLRTPPLRGAAGPSEAGSASTASPGVMQLPGAAAAAAATAAEGQTSLSRPDIPHLPQSPPHSPLGSVGSEGDAGGLSAAAPAHLLPAAYTPEPPARGPSDGLTASGVRLLLSQPGLPGVPTPSVVRELAGGEGRRNAGGSRLHADTAAHSTPPFPPVSLADADAGAGLSALRSPEGDAGAPHRHLSAASAFGGADETGTGHHSAAANPLQGIATPNIAAIKQAGRAAHAVAAAAAATSGHKPEL
jgi:hypothetical protein